MSTATSKLARNGKKLVKVTMGPREASAVLGALNSFGGDSQSARLAGGVADALRAHCVIAAEIAPYTSSIIPTLTFVS